MMINMMDANPIALVNRMIEENNIVDFNNINNKLNNQKNVIYCIYGSILILLKSIYKSIKLMYNSYVPQKFDVIQKINELLARNTRVYDKVIKPFIAVLFCLFIFLFVKLVMLLMSVIMLILKVIIKLSFTCAILVLFIVIGRYFKLNEWVTKVLPEGIEDQYNQLVLGNPIAQFIEVLFKSFENMCDTAFRNDDAYD